jgi:dATP pyrophosphohydrolase
MPGEAAVGRPWKRPESVLVVVCTAAGEVLMLRRRDPPDFWQSVTGSLEWGETARHAAARELFEETGLRAGGALEDCRHRERFPIVGPWRARYAPAARFNLEHWFRLRLPGRRTIRLNLSEHRECRWLDAAAAAARATSWSNRAAIRRLVREGWAADGRR